MRTFRNTLLLLTTLVIGFSVLGCEPKTNDEAIKKTYASACDMYENEQYIEALNVFTECLRQSKTQNCDSIHLRSLLAVGNIYALFDDYEQALRYYTRCYEETLEKKDDNVRQRVTNNMLLCNSMLGNAEKAAACMRQLAHTPLGSDTLNIFYSFVNQGLVAQAKKDPMAARFFNRQALDYAESHDMHPRYAASQYGMLGNNEMDMGNFKEAESYYLKCCDIAEKEGSTYVLRTACQKLTELYRITGDSAGEAHFQKLNALLIDSVFNKQKFNDAQGRLINYEQSTTDEELLSLNNRINWQWWIIGAFLLVTIVVTTLGIIIYRQNRSLSSTYRLLASNHRDRMRQVEMERELRDEYLSIMNKKEEKENNEESSEELSDEQLVSPLLGKQQTEALIAAISRVMEDTSIISDTEFNLQKLAQHVGSNTKYVSWVINSTYGKNFKTYLNEHRIQEASKMLTDRENYGHLTIIAIAEKVGFKSPTSFNMAFKKTVGMTPSAYQKLSDEERAENEE